MKQTTFNFRVPERLKAEFIKAAEKSYMTQAEAIRHCMRQLIEEQKKEPQSEN